MAWEASAWALLSLKQLHQVCVAYRVLPYHWLITSAPSASTEFKRFAVSDNLQHAAAVNAMNETYLIDLSLVDPSHQVMIYYILRQTNMRPNLTVLCRAPT